MNVSFFGELLQTISERGHALLDRGRARRGIATEHLESRIPSVWAALPNCPACC
jgi:hypothetical protein